MKITLRNPKQALNKAYLKEKVIRDEFDLFKKNLHELIQKTRTDESEEHSKNPLINFLKDTFYRENNEINTKDRIDLVIYNDKTSKSSAGVLIEVKKSANTSEMITKTDFNKKAFHELILYYLRERIEEKNIDIKYIIATNIYEWFIFDTSDFEKLFYKNSKLVKDYNEWNTKQKVTQNTDLFYNDITKPFLNSLTDELKCTYFDLRDYKIDSTEKEDEKKLIPLYKIFSPAHLLKQPFANDSNRLDRAFYNELLHIIGLEETKEKNKKIITRKSEKNRDKASLLENAVAILKSRDKLSGVRNIQSYGKDKEERAFNVALELCITWINRILFLKLLEAQLYKYHDNNSDYKFLNENSIPDYDELDKLFFEVLAVNTGDREKAINAKYSRVPYLNSSLFEPSELEKSTIFIANLDDNKKLTFFNSTVLKDKSGKRRKDEKKHTLHYLFEFLEAYDFTSEGREEIQEENKTLINASVLGLIFEKINGYKDGSFFTPGFITMYMCRETIRRAVVQKFNDKYEWKCEEFDDLYNHLTGKTAKEIKEYNSVINSLTLCDPAVGSGHFLVSALNEIIAIKSELGILADEKGRTLRDYDIRIENDELIVTSHQGTELFEYIIHNNKPHEESQRVQKTLFHEKQSIIENCLFGVDINPNSVKIARLRLWIELLKNAYYTDESGFKELETLPNIDINIKEGNSLISRFAIDTDLKQILKTIKWKVDDYRKLVYEYKNEHNKEKKQAVKKLIDDIKSNFRTEISARDPRVKKLNDLTYELHNKYRTERLIDVEMQDKEKEKLKKEEEKLVNKIEKLSAEIKEIEEGEIYRNAFEWRFEFPEVLADNGDYIGFDVVIGNPPYIRAEEIKLFKNYFKQSYQVDNSSADIFYYFNELAYKILLTHGFFCFINNTYERTTSGITLRNFMNQNFGFRTYIDFTNAIVFDEATTYPIIILAQKNGLTKEFNYLKIPSEYKKEYSTLVNGIVKIKQETLSDSGWNFYSKSYKEILNKLGKHESIRNLFGKTYYGIKTALNEAFIISKRLDNVDKEKNVIEGKDIKKWFTPRQDKFMLVFESGFTRNKYGEIDEKTAIKFMSNDYRQIMKHLIPFREKASIRYDKGEFWWELRNCAYYKLFSKHKIIFPNLQNDNKFAWDESGRYLNAPAVFLPTNDKYLISLLNSKLIWFFLRNICVVRNGGYIEVKPQYFEQIPIPVLTGKTKNILSKLVDKIIQNKMSECKEEISKLESQIDILVYKLYELNYEEVKIVDSTFALTEDEYNNYKVE